MKLAKVTHHLAQKRKDPYFKELYQVEQQKLAIVKRIIAYRIKNKLSQKQLAQKAAVTQQHISKIENGEFSSVLTLEKIMLLIGYTVRLKAVPLSRRQFRRIEKKLRRAA